MRDRVLTAAAWVAAPLVFLLLYARNAGLGFISDDFGWISDSRAASMREAAFLLFRNHGFYRPAVAWSFAADYAFFGLAPRGYGLTNLALAVIAIGLIWRLGRALELSSGASALAAAMWGLNFHGVNMAILWISGRTALCLIVFALAAAVAVAGGRVVLAWVCLALALLSKEEAVLLPALLIALALLKPGGTPRGLLAVFVAGCAIELTIYGVLRMHAGAMTPATAPYYYQFTFRPSAVLRNAAEYADRAATFVAAMSLIAWALLRPAGPAAPPRRSMLVLAAIWVVCGFGITLFLPVRSSLYACFPSIGVALAGAEFCATRWRAASLPHRRAALSLAAVVPLACLPLHETRNHRWTNLARFSTATMNELAPELTRVPPGTTVVLEDDRSRKVNLQAAFGVLIADALRLRTGRDVPVWIDPPLTDAALAGFAPPCVSCPQRHFAVEEGRVIPQ